VRDRIYGEILTEAASHAVATLATVVVPPEASENANAMSVSTGPSATRCHVALESTQRGALLAKAQKQRNL